MHAKDAKLTKFGRKNEKFVIKVLPQYFMMYYELVRVLWDVCTGRQLLIVLPWV